MTTSAPPSSSSSVEGGSLRQDPQPPGGLSPVDAARLGTLPRYVRQLRHTLRYVDYPQAERDSETLAARLLEAYSREELRGFAVQAVPRGGLIVLGMLSYMLDLTPDQLSGEVASDRPLLLVDDCALSGARLHAALAASANPRVVFAHLYSHPDLREAIVEREERVESCVAAADLVDHARRLYGDDYERWLRSARDHLGGPRYWLGLPDLVCFAWSEPDRPIWNPASNELERGWRLLPPRRCLKARSRLGPPPAPVESPAWRVAEGVVTAEQGDSTWLYCLETDRIFSLDGVGAEMWRALSAWGDVEAAVQFLSDQFDASPATLRRDLEAFAGSLAEHRLLTAAGS